MDILRAFYASPETLGFRRLPPRAAMVESRSCEQARSGASDRLSLDGEWEFYTCPSPEAAFRAIEGGGFGERRKIRVPSSWGEIAGFDAPQYTNVQMPFPGNPPCSPEHNPTGVYFRTFALDAPAEFTVLRFEGVEGIFTAWINGEFAGGSKEGR